MLASTIKHGDLSYDLQSNGWVTLTRFTTGQCIQMSPSELRYFMAVLQLHGWPTAPPLMCGEDDNVQVS